MTDKAQTTELPIAIFVHVHYPDIWEQMSLLLARRVNQPFKLIITTSHPREKIALPLTKRMLSARILSVENRGRDILPFLEALAVTKDFELGIKLHTKKSPQRKDGAAWRGEVLDSLIPARGSQLKLITKHLQADPRIGFVTPSGFCLSVKPWVLVNAPGMVTVMHTLGSPLVEQDLDDCYFAAGSMFWFRRSSLAALAAPAVRNLFEAEEGQFDGTIAHAMERLFPVETQRQGYVSLAIPALLASQPAMESAQLRELAHSHADVPSTYFPAPYVAALDVKPNRPTWLKAALQRAGVSSLILRIARGSVAR